MQRMHLLEAAKVELWILLLGTRAITASTISRTIWWLWLCVFTGQLGPTYGAGVVGFKPRENTVLVKAVLARQLQNLSLCLKLSMANRAGISGFAGGARGISIIPLFVSSKRYLPASAEVHVHNDQLDMEVCRGWDADADAACCRNLSLLAVQSPNKRCQAIAKPEIHMTRPANLRGRESRVCCAVG